jgi:hypothetical protein
MARSGLNSISSSSDWAAVKPASYKGTDLDKALKAYHASHKESLAVPKLDLTTYKVKDINDNIADLQTFLSKIKSRIAALKAVNAAAKKTVGELKDQDAITYVNSLSTDAVRILKMYE